MLRSLLNQRLGRYEIKELLGRGGMAAVYRASDTVLLRDVALKILYPQFSDDASLVQRFQREAVTAASLEHPGIVPVYDVGEHDGMAYIAMKLLSGQTMQEWLQASGALGLDALLAVLAPVAAALDYAHVRGVVHRDIKPGNVFLSETADGRRVMLTDFGIAKQLDTPGLTTTGAMIGTPDYMAPEQIAGRPVDARTDIYALGMLAYRALTGRRAFEGSTQDVLLGHLYDRPLPPSQLNPALPPGVDAVIDQATDVDPAARYPSAGAFVTALRQVARGAPASTAVGPPPALPPRPLPVDPRAPTRRVPAPDAVLRQPSAPVAAAATSATAARATAPAPASPARARGVAPWLLAVLLALLAGGLAVALVFALSRQESAGGAPSPVPSVPPPPPSETAAPTPGEPSATPDSGAVATATSEPSATVAQPTASAPPATITLTPSPLATPVPSPSATPPPTQTLAPTETLTPTASPSPTETLLPTETVAPITPTSVAQCDDRLLVGGFGKLFDDNIGVRTRLGCPQAPEVAGDGSQQFFEQGLMFYWDRRNKTLKDDYVYVFYGRDAGVYDGLPPQAVADLGPDPTPGPDPNQPVRGFGRVYFNWPMVRERLGAPTSPELELKANQRGVIQLFADGLMIYTPAFQPTNGASIFVLYNDGAFERFDDSFGG